MIVSLVEYRKVRELVAKYGSTPAMRRPPFAGYGGRVWASLAVLGR